LLAHIGGRRALLSVYATSNTSLQEKDLLLFPKFVLLWRGDSKLSNKKNSPSQHTWPGLMPCLYSAKKGALMENQVLT